MSDLNLLGWELLEDNSKELLSVEIPHLSVQQLLLGVLDQVLDTYQRSGGSKGVHVMSIRA